MTTRNIDIIVTERGSRTVKRNIDEIGNSAQKAGGAVEFMRRTLQLIGGALALNKLKQASDEFTGYENTLKLVTKTQGELSRAMEDTFRIAQATRSDLGSVGSLYATLQLNASQLGLSMSEVATVTEQVNKNLAISSKNTTQASAAILQLSQALGSGILRGDEFNSINENGKAILIRLAESMNVPIGALRGMAEAGELTADKVVKAMLTTTETTDALFKKMQPTIGQSLIVLNNAFTQFIGMGNKTTGISAAIANSIIFLAKNLELLGGVFSAAAGGAVAYALVMRNGVGGALTFVTARMTALTAAIAANPFGAIAVAITAAVSALTYFKDQIFPVQGSLATLGDYGRVVFNKLGGWMTTAGDYMTALGEKIGNSSWWNAFMNFGSTALSFVSNLLVKTANKAIDLYNTLMPGTALDMPRIEQQAAAIASVGSAWKSAAEDVAKARQIAEDGKGVGGGSGGGVFVNPAAVKKEKDALDKLKSTFRSLQDQLDPMGALNRKFAEDQAVLNEALKAGIIQLAEYKNLMIELRLQYESGMSELAKETFDPTPVQAYMMELQDLSDDFQNVLVGAIRSSGDALAEFVVEGKGGLKALGDIMKDVAKQIISLIAQKMILQSIGSFFPSLGTGIVASAKGNVFDGGKVQAFANGGVVNSPTLFPLRSGVGLMGEAGPEAILPLERAPDGKLGVRGGGGLTNVFSPTITVNVEGGGQAGNGQELGGNIAKLIGKELDIRMSEFTRRQTRPGGMLNSMEAI